VAGGGERARGVALDSSVHPDPENVRMCLLWHTLACLATGSRRSWLRWVRSFLRRVGVNKQKIKGHVVTHHHAPPDTCPLLGLPSLHLSLIRVHLLARVTLAHALEPIVHDLSIASAAECIRARHEGATSTRALPSTFSHSLTRAHRPSSCSLWVCRGPR
jgi:hypothetical protein